MIWRGTRPIAALAAVALCAGALSACGGSDSNSGSSSSSTSSTGSEKGQGGEGASEKKQASGGGTQKGSKEGGESRQSAATSPLHVSGGGSGQFRVKGGDNSIQEFGEESSESELEEAAAALHEFLVARAEEDWRTACARLSKTVLEQLEQLASQAKSGSGKSCAATLETLTPPLPAVVRRETTIVDAGSLRIEGERAFLIYRGAEGAVYAITMAHEDGQWKVGALAPIPLS